MIMGRFPPFLFSLGPSVLTLARISFKVSHRGRAKRKKRILGEKKVLFVQRGKILLSFFPSPFPSLRETRRGGGGEKVFSFLFCYSSTFIVLRIFPLFQATADAVLLRPPLRTEDISPLPPPPPAVERAAKREVEKWREKRKE